MAALMRIVKTGLRPVIQKSSLLATPHTPRGLSIIGTQTSTLMKMPKCNIIFSRNLSICLTKNVAANNRPFLQITPPRTCPVRTKIVVSRTRGKNKPVKSVYKRFFRLHTGQWIRTMCGRSKKLWKKTPQRRHRLRQHVFCNRTQSKLLDKMVGPIYQRKGYYPNDPYEPYHKRTGLDDFYYEPPKFFP